MVALATCRYCEAAVPHEVCVELAVPDPMPVDVPPHVHQYLCEMACDDSAYVVKDCGCGDRIRVFRDAGGKETILDDGLIADAGSVANAAFVQRLHNLRAGGFNHVSNWTDRWAGSL